MQTLQYLAILHVIAFALCRPTFAQMPGPEQWADDQQSWSGTEREDRGYWTADQQDPLFVQPYTIGPRPRRSSTVTLHELAHHVPRRAEKDYARAMNAKRKGDVDSAIVYFTKAIDADPEFCAAINDLGVTYLRLDRITPAIELFSKAITVDPHAPAAYINLAAAYVAQSRYADAEHTARRAKDLDRGGTRAPLILGASLVLEKKFTAEAERSLTKAASDFAVARLWLAIGLLGHGDITSAKQNLEMYLSRAGGQKAVVDYARTLLHKLESVGHPK